jgi:formate/nitrite transporter FocA (FNT family)
MTDLAARRQSRLTDRWPTALAIVTVAFAIGLMVLLDDEAELFGPSVAVMAGIYLLAYVLGRPWTAWVAFAVMSGVMSALQVLHRLDVSWADPFVGIVLVLALLWLAAVARRRYTDLDTFSLQTAGMVVFGVVTLVCAVLSPRAGAAVAGAGFLGHGLWDAYHFKVDKVVHRSWSEYCAVIDIPTGIALVVVALA